MEHEIIREALRVPLDRLVQCARFDAVQFRQVAVEHHAMATEDKDLPFNDHYHTGSKSAQTFNQSAGSDVASTSLPNIERNGRDYVREIHNKRPAGLGRESGDSIVVLAPRAVLVERFYRSRSRHEAGETAKTLHHGQITGPMPQPEDLRVPAAALLRYAIRKDETAKPFLGPMTSSVITSFRLA